MLMVARGCAVVGAFMVHLAVGSLSHAAGGGGPGWLKVRLSPAGAVSAPSWWSDGAALPEAVEVRGGGEELEVGQVCARPGLLVFTQEDRVSWPLRLEGADACSPQPLAVQLVPAGRVKGTVRPPRPLRAPQRGEVGLWPCTSADAGSPLARYPVPVHTDGGFAAALPAGCWYLEVSLPGSAPAVVGPVTVRAGQPTRLSQLTLQAGGTLAARLRDWGTGTPARAQLFALPAEQGEEALCALLQGDRPQGVRGHASDPRGWTVLAGLPAGRYTLVAVGAGGDTGVVPEVEVTAEELRVAEVTVHPPGALRLRAPALGRVRASGLEVEARAEWVTGGQPTVCARSAPFDAEGQAELPALLAGTWKLQVAVRQEGCLSIVGGPLVEVVGGERQELELDFSRHVVEGRVERGRESVEGEVVFFRDEGHALVALHRTRSDEEGRFSALIEAAGRYGVEVLASSPAGRWWLPDVAVPLDGEEVVLRIPAGEVQGVALDEGDRGLAGAAVRAEAVLGKEGGRWWPADAWIKSEKGGQFSLTGLAPGRWSVGLWSEALGTWESNVEAVEVPRDGRVGGIVLRRSPTRAVRGRLTTAGHGVAGAQVWVLYALGGGGAGSGVSAAVTNGRGEFAAAVPRSAAPVVHVAVCAPPGVLAVAPFAEDEPVEVSLGEAPGALGLRFPSEDPAPIPVLALHSDRGGVLPLGLALACHSRREGQVVWMGVTAGRWRLVRLRQPGELAWWMAGLPVAPQAVHTVWVAAGGGGGEIPIPAR